MPLAVLCVCGKQFQVLDELAGKRVKCPACQQIVAVPGTLVLPLPAAPEQESADEDEFRPAGKKKKKGSGSSKVLLWVGLGSGAVVLSLACCCGGFGVWFFVIDKMV